MTRSSHPIPQTTPDGSIALLAVSARRARILRWRDGVVIQEEIASDVPGRHRSTGHVRHDPMVRHGGSGTGENEMEGQRLQRIQRFLARVADAVRDEDRILVLGSGRLPRQLAHRLEEAERGRPNPRQIELETIGYHTDHQLRQRLLVEAGHPAQRRHAPPRPQVGTLRRRPRRVPRPEAEWEAEEPEPVSGT